MASCISGTVKPRKMFSHLTTPLKSIAFDCPYTRPPRSLKKRIGFLKNILESLRRFVHILENFCLECLQLISRNFNLGGQQLNIFCDVVDAAGVRPDTNEEHADKEFIVPLSQRMFAARRTHSNTFAVSSEM